MRSGILIAVVLCMVFSGCAGGGFDSVKKTQQLSAGMTYEQVVQLLGEPKTTEFRDGRRIATFRLHQAYRGNVPFDMVFSGKPERLESWSENQEKFEANQKMLAQLVTAIDSTSGGATTPAGPAGPNDPNLQQQIAGVWWGYAGSTERSIGLCPDGSYRDYTESGYSGHSYNQYGDETMAWGAANQGGGSGTWTISGTTRSGTIHVRYSDGSSANIQYREIGDPGCFSFDGNTLCRKSASCQ